MLRSISIFLCALMLVAFSAAPAAAGEKLGVSITALGGPDATSGTFTITGAAAGSLCSTGTWRPGEGKGLHWLSEDTFKVDVEKVLTCDGSEKSFTLRLRATIILGVTSIHPRWTVVDSAGFDPAPRGSGEIVAVEPGSADGEVYVGLMMFH